MTTVSRRARQVDLGAITLIAVGIALFLFSAMRMHTISLYSRTNPGPRHAIEATDRARYVYYAGVALVGLGCCVGIGAAGFHQLRRVPA